MTLNTLFRVLAAMVAPAFLAVALAAPLAHADEDGPVAVRAVPQYPSVAQGGQLVIAVEMDHKEHFHTWPAKEVKLPDAIDEFAIRTEIGAAKDKDDKRVIPGWVAGVDGVQYPAAKNGKVADPTGAKPTVEVPLYAGKAVSYVRVAVKDDAPLGEQTFMVQVSFQSCNEQTCTAPEEVLVAVKVKVVAKGSKDLGTANEQSTFEKFDAKKWGSGAGAAGGQATPKPSVMPSPGPNLGGIQIGGGIVVLFLVAVLGGIILDLTPCVLPVIPIKVLTLTQHTKSPHKRVVLGLWVASGVVAFWAAAGLPMVLVSANLDPSKLIFGMWWVTLVLGIIIAAMGLGIMGLFTISLPQAVYLVNPKHESALGSFLSGVMTAVLGLPCFGFVAGGLLAGAATLPPLSIMAVFVGIGVGMALPYYILTVWPQLLKFIPRTGPVSDLVKQVMGLLLLAGAAFFIAVGIKTLVATYPAIGATMNWWAVTFFIALASLWMVYRTFQITKKALLRAFAPVVAVLLFGGALYFTYGLTFSEVPWTSYTESAFDKAVSDRKVVVVDFTADWCITCKFLKRTVLDADPVKGLLKSAAVVPLEVDLTPKTAPGWEKMGALGQTGIPTLAIYGPGVQQPIILNAYTSTMVKEAIEKARGAALTATPATAPLPSH